MPQLPDPKEVGRFYAMAQVGLEMVAPIGLGLALDYWFDWTPWGVVVGAVVGLVGGIAHLVVLSNPQDGNGSGKPSRDTR